METHSKENAENFFITLSEKYLELGNGAKADLKRASAPSDLLSLGAFFRLCRVETNLPQYARVVFILPWLAHKKDITLGELFYSGDGRRGISEARMVQMLRSDWPQDIICLRRMIWQSVGRHAEKGADWSKLGEQLFYWGENNKQRILQDYYLAEIRNERK